MSMRRHTMCLVTIALASLLWTARGWAAEAIAATGDPDHAFDTFCTSWMGKLAEREAANVHHIQWQHSGPDVQGEYVGYSKTHTCNVKYRPGSPDPIGKVIYNEFRLRKRGGSIVEATSSQPEVVDVTEVTEIFRYAKGQWVY